MIEFSEALFREERDRMAAAIQDADLIVVLGTSAVVNPLRKTLYDNFGKRLVTE